MEAVETMKDILAEKSDYVNELKPIQEELQKMGISGNRAYFQRGTIPPEIWKRRSFLGKEVLRLEKLIVGCNDRLRLVYNEQDAVRDLIIETFGEKFKKDFIERLHEGKRGNRQSEFVLQQLKQDKLNRFFKNIKAARNCSLKPGE